MPAGNCLHIETRFEAPPNGDRKEHPANPYALSEPVFLTTTVVFIVMSLCADGVMLTDEMRSAPAELVLILVTELKRPAGDRTSCKTLPEQSGLTDA